MGSLQRVHSILSPAPLRVRRLAVVAGWSLALAACQHNPPLPAEALRYPEPSQAYTPSDVLQQFDEEPAKEYRLGEGDTLTIQVWDRADLSGAQGVGPDGAITLPVAGTLRVTGMTRDEAAKAVKDALSRYYANIIVTIRVDRYAANRVVVVGRVAAPGAQQFDGMPTLLEALARAGGVQAGGEGRQPYSHCAIMRGRDRVAWLDLRRLLEDGDLGLNLRLKPNDIVFVPDREDLPIYVLGEVSRPGPLRWKSGLSFLDAVAQAGGPSRDAAVSKIILVRPNKGLRMLISQEDLLKPDPSLNIALERGDIVYVPSDALADIGYFFEKIPIFEWVFVGSSIRAASVPPRRDR